MGNKKMTTIFYSQLDEPNIEKVIEDIKLYHPSKIVLFCETEWDSRELCEDWATVLNAHNIELTVVVGSYPDEYYSEKTKHFKYVQVVNWPTHWINWTLMCSSLLDFNIKYESFKYPFICLNNKNHAHRCALIDELTRNNLLDKGIVTWHRFPNQTPSDHRYKFKYYDDSIRLIGDDFVTKLDSFLIPPEYHQSFLHVIGEATTNVTFITEKTCLPILYRKPWVIMSTQHFHKKLIDLGFELYDEIIDYSFDDEPDMEKRAYAISENVKRISEQDTTELYKLIKPKADKNYNNYMRILKSRKYIPRIIHERAKMVKEGCERRTYTDNRYTHMVNNALILL